MKITIALALFLGVNTAVKIGSYQTIADLPSCATVLTQKDVVLKSDHSNSGAATCKEVF